MPVSSSMSARIAMKYFVHSLVIAVFTARTELKNVPQNKMESLAVKYRFSDNVVPHLYLHIIKF